MIGWCGETVIGWCGVKLLWPAIAVWFVSDDWLVPCACPEPLPPDWDWFAVWFVVLEFDADDVALLLRYCEAELSPPVTLPPPIVTGTLAFTASCLAFASLSAYWFVEEPCFSDWAWPEPPQPYAHELELD